LDFSNDLGISDGETTKIKVLDPKKLWNFVDYNIFIWICLGPQTIIFCFFVFFVSNCDFWNWAKILLLAQTAQSSITLAKLAGPYISSHLDIYICCFYIYMLLLLNIRIDICIRPSLNPIHTVFDTHYSYP